MNQTYKKAMDQNKKLKERNAYLHKELEELKELVGVFAEYDKWAIESGASERTDDINPLKDNDFVLRSHGGHEKRLANLPDFKEKWWRSNLWNSIHHGLTNVHNLEFVLEPDMEFGPLMPSISFTEGKELEAYAYCDMVVPTQDGPALHFFDPPLELTFEPTELLSQEEAEKCVGRFCQFTFIKKGDTYKLKDIFRLPYTLKERLISE